MPTEVKNVKEASVVLGNYKNLGIKREMAVVTQEDILKAQEQLRQDNREEMRLMQCPANLGDTVKIDFEGFIGGEAFEGGKGDNYDLELGSHSFIDGFEEQLVGASTGDTVKVNVRFPENYSAQALAGKEAEFVVTIKEVKRVVIPDFGLPLVIVATDFNTVEEFNECTSMQIAAKKQEQLDGKWQDKLLAEIVENSVIVIPETLVESESEEIFQEYTNKLGKDGVSIEAYLEYINLSGQQFIDQIKLEAKHRIECRTVLGAIADAENIEVTDEEIQSEIQKAADANHRLVVELERMMTDEYRQQLKNDIQMQKAMRMIMKNNMTPEGR